jgi:hypothetical protein
MKEFLKDFNSKRNWGCFCDYCSTKLEERYYTQKISKLSCQVQQATALSCRSLLLPFADIKA